MTLSRTRMLVMAKAPVPGRAKTRLAATVGYVEAAAVATAALLDTLTACTEAVGPRSCVLALAGDLDDSVSPDDVRVALAGWTVLAQRGDGFAERLALAHLDVGDGDVVQVGMDTPQLTPELLLAAAEPLQDHDTVLGPAPDGGWWVLARREASAARVLHGVPMSTPTTYADTRTALLGAGLSVATTSELRDVDTREDADAVAAAAPTTHFARTWAALQGVSR